MEIAQILALCGATFGFICFIAAIIITIKAADKA